VALLFHQTCEHIRWHRLKEKRLTTMQTLSLQFPANTPFTSRTQVGCVGSGDLEVLLQPATDPRLTIDITTSADGNTARWNLLFERLFANRDIPAAHLCIHDFGATPGVVRLRIEQALEEARHV